MHTHEIYRENMVEKTELTKKSQKVVHMAVCVMCILWSCVNSSIFLGKAFLFSLFFRWKNCDFSPSFEHANDQRIVLSLLVHMHVPSLSSSFCSSASCPTFPANERPVFMYVFNLNVSFWYHSFSLFSFVVFCRALMKIRYVAYKLTGWFFLSLNRRMFLAYQRCNLVKLKWKT